MKAIKMSSNWEQLRQYIPVVSPARMFSEKQVVELFIPSVEGQLLIKNEHAEFIWLAK